METVIEAPVIEVRGLTTRFGAQLVHDGVDLTVQRGEIMGLVGGSGSGKSVLLHSIIGLRKPNAGQVKVLGQDVRSLSESELRHLDRHWGVLFQDGALFSSLTVAQNIEVPMREHVDMHSAAANYWTSELINAPDRPKVYVSDYILDEAATRIREKVDHKKAVVALDLLRELIASGAITMARIEGVLAATLRNGIDTQIFAFGSARRFPVAAGIARHVDRGQSGVGDARLPSEVSR